ncbi:hypothetical protein Pan97_31050 [Bremerella volcania]|uniref:Neutral/alkaline non-lysosomal ceramidase n=1 Tax=Bremerella volcania TaxID=2527984 RepID=A0A518CA12_9BACT|nr:hypothetical protein [Bremerella volcania]QDU76060.1 hypothetical protein Pan97_31050 [Bremerella volcania]
MRFFSVTLAILFLGIGNYWLCPALLAENLHFSIGSAEITPDVQAPQAVWMAGYYPGRAATSVHDPLFARGMLLSDGQTKIALVSLDLIGWSYPSTIAIREQLPEIDFVVICSTHNHEGPDTIGIWGESFIKRGVDEQYNQHVEKTIVHLVKRLDQSQQPVTVEFATIDRPDLVHDTRQPIVIDPTIRVLRFRSQMDGSTLGLLVQGTTHPESLGARNTAITADFPCYTQKRLKQHFDCPTVYVSGAIGGLMTPPAAGIVNDKGWPVRLTTFAYAEAYGNEVADAVAEALEKGQPVDLTPFRILRKEIAIPIDNPLYRLARSLNVIRRVSYEWTGQPESWGKRVTREFRPDRAAAITEVSLLQLGDVKLLGIPGELYPELVFGKIPNPADANVDFPEAPPEPHITRFIGDEPYLLLGLANDEIGYIIPKRQWDREAPYAFGRGAPQYGEINSCSHEVGPIIMDTFAELCQRAQSPTGEP